MTKKIQTGVNPFGSLANIPQVPGMPPIVEPTFEAAGAQPIEQAPEDAGDPVENEAAFEDAMNAMSYAHDMSDEGQKHTPAVTHDSVEASLTQSFQRGATQEELDNQAASLEAAYQRQRDETFASLGHLHQPASNAKPTNVAKTPQPGQKGFNPFIHKVAPPPPIPVEKFDEQDGLIGWGAFVKFVQQHKEIIQARYPNPRGDCIDTIYKGVPVFNHPTVEYRHKDHGWVSHEVATQGL